MGRSDSTRRVLAVLVCIAGLARPVSSLAQSSPSSPTSRASAVTFTGVVTDTAGAPVRNAVVSLVGGVGVRARLEVLGRWTFRNGRFILAALFVVLALQNLLKAL